MPDINNSIVYNFALNECLRCGTTKREHGVEAESSRTCYHHDHDGEDPNAPIMLCRPCAKMHHEEWDERWSEYYSGLL